MFLILDRDNEIKKRVVKFHDVQNGYLMSIKLLHFYSLLDLIKKTVIGMSGCQYIINNFEHGDHIYRLSIFKKEGGMIKIEVFQKPIETSCTKFEIEEKTLLKLREICRDKTIDGFIFEDGEKMQICRRA